VAFAALVPAGPGAAAGSPGAAPGREISERDILRGWTWSVQSKPAGSDDEDASETSSAGVQVLALDVDRSGDVLVAGGVAGKAKIGGKVVGSARGPQGFVARVDAAGAATLVKALAGVAPAVTAMRADATGVFAASADRGVFRVDRSGREVWSLPDLAHPNALALLRNRDLVTGGCERWTGPTPYPGATPGDRIGRGYVARLTAKGSLKWKFSFGAGSASNPPATCVTDVAEGPNGDLYVSGVFGQDIVVGTQKLASSSGYQFVARFSSDGQPRWAHTLPLDPSSEPLAPRAGQPFTDSIRRAIDRHAPVRIAALASGEVAVAGGIVRTATGSAVGLAMLREDGALKWLLPIGGSKGTDVVEDTVVTSRGGDVFVAGAFAGDLRVGDQRISQPPGAADGVFFVRVRGDDGTATSLKRIPPIVGSSTRVVPGQDAHPTAIAAGRGAVWIGGKVEDISAGFIHRVSM
jgi:hypothetical protein